MGDRRAWILDDALQPVPEGVTGELHIGGAVLARGYHGRPALTAERFVPDPQGAPGARMYRTGDLARWGADGAVAYVGRRDHQVKVRGYRIELGEVEAALLDQPCVAEAAAAAAGPDGARRLVGYVARAADGRPEDEAEAELKAAPGKRLPDYMVPARILRLDALPRLATGKVDRCALPEPAAAITLAAVVPEGEAERVLAAIWGALLGVAAVGATDNFFDLGGDSILSLQLVARARAAGLLITPRQVFQRQTVRDLAAVAGAVEPARPAPRDEAEGEAPLTPIQHWFFAQPMPRRHRWNQSVELVARDAVDAPALAAALAAIEAAHDALRLRFTQTPDGAWRQRAAPEATAELLWRRDVADEAALAGFAEALQGSLDLGAGPLLRAGLATLPDGGARLLLVIHHLAVDGVSWRVLLADLEAAYAAAAAGAPVAPGPRSASFATWGRRLDALARSPALEAELDHWRVAASGAPAFPPARPQGADRVGAAQRHRIAFDAATTRRLMEAPRAWRARLNELLVTALARALCARAGAEAVTIAMEGHGRDGAGEDLDLSRTIGWFTSVSPVRLAPGRGDAVAALKTVKE